MNNEPEEPGDEHSPPVERPSGEHEHVYISIEGELDTSLGPDTDRRKVMPWSSQFGHLEEKLADYQLSNNLRFLRMEQRLTQQDTALAANTAITVTTSKNMEDVHDLLMAAQSGIDAIAKFGRGLAWIGHKFFIIGMWLFRLLKWGGVVGAAVSAILLAVYEIRHGGSPPGK